MVEPARIDGLLTRLKGYVEVLKKLAAVPRDRFLADGDKIGNAKYHFVVAIECVIDIAHHIIASEKLRIPADSSDSFAVLVEAALLPRDALSSLQAMTKFRNRLVRLHWDVDDAMVHSYLQDSLDDFDRFAAAIASLPRWRTHTPDLRAPRVSPAPAG